MKSLPGIAFFSLLVMLSACGSGNDAALQIKPKPAPAAPLPGTLQLSASTYSVNESAGTVKVQITRTGGNGGPLTANLATSNGTATAGQDFTATTTSVTFDDGDTTTKSIDIPVTNDSLTESAETFTVTLTSATASAIGSPATATVAIQDDDLPVGSIQLSGATFTVSESGGSVVIGVDRVNGSSGAVAATIATQAGTATAGQDFTALNSTVSFAAGDTTRKTITIPIFDDALTEADESFTVVLSAPTGGASLGTVSTATITISANDPPGPPPPPGPAGALQLSAASITVSESSANAAITVTRTSGTSGVVSVRVATADGSALAGQDYTAVDTTVTFANGDAANKIVNIPILNDSVAEVSESFSVTLSNVTGGATFGATTLATVNIDNDDRPAAPTLSVTATIRQLHFTWSTVPLTTAFKMRENLDGVSGFTQIGSNLSPSTTSFDLDISTFKVNWPSALYRLEACNQVGCTGSTPLSPTSSMLSSIGYFKAASVDSDDHFGASIAMSADGNTLVVGAPEEDSNATTINGDETNNLRTDSGAVFVFARTNGVWAREAYLKASNATAGDKFGSTLSISTDGGTLVVGAPDQSTATGGVYVFVRSGTTWSQEAALTAPNAEVGDKFGASVGIASDGNTLVVGAPGEDSSATIVNGNQASNTALGAGAAYIFARTGVTWGFTTYLKAPNTGAGDAFGTSVAYGNGFIAVGAPGEDSDGFGAVTPIPNNNNNLESGAVYVFSYALSAWQSMYLKSLNSEAGDRFGTTLSLNSFGDTLAVGAPGEDGNASSPIYTLGVDATFLANTFPPDASGCALSTPGTAKCDSGAIYVWSRVGYIWSQQAYVKASNRETLDELGSAIALSADGNALIAGSINEDSSSLGIGGNQALTNATSSGAAYLFNRVGTSWSQRSYIKATNTEASDAFGASVAIDFTGDTLSVGATGEDSNAVNVGGDQTDNSLHDAGAAYLY